jgi:MarR family transcriptional regulator, organic hydroperoxide resistance regulator
MKPETETDLAASLLDIAPRLLRRLGADLPLESNTACDPAWREVNELRATPGQLALLCELVEHEPCTMQELAEHLGVTPSTATAMVKRLVMQGYIERSRDESDWRAVWVRPTHTGRRAVQVFLSARLGKLRQRLNRLSKDEQASIQAALPALYRLIDDQPQPSLERGHDR